LAANDGYVSFIRMGVQRLHPLDSSRLRPTCRCRTGKLRERLTTEVTVVFPGAERFGMEEGSPPVSFVPTYQQIEL
jgi:hypothetical protein